MNEIEYQVSKRWKAGKDFRKPFEHRLETSDQDVLLRRVDMSDILSMGLVDDLDFTSKAIAQIGENAAETAEDKTKNPFFENGGANFKRLETLVNAVTVAGVIAPKIYAVPEHEAARQDGLLYVDEIPWDDRMELFGLIFGGGNEESFREESDTAVGTVEDVPSVSLPADEPVATGPDESAGVLSESSSI